MFEYIISLLILACCAFVQNMSFTWTSRSRNSGNPNYHRKAAYCSNGIWFFTYILVWREVWAALSQPDALWKLIPLFIVYSVATAEGSVFMMKILLRKEKGSHRVGANNTDTNKPCAHKTPLVMAVQRMAQNRNRKRRNRLLKEVARKMYLRVVSPFFSTEELKEGKPVDWADAGKAQSMIKDAYREHLGVKEEQMCKRVKEVDDAHPVRFWCIPDEERELQIKPHIDNLAAQEKIVTQQKEDGGG